jgi:hypothetical protein
MADPRHPLHFDREHLALGMRVFMATQQRREAALAYSGTRGWASGILLGAALHLIYAPDSSSHRSRPS